jgi:hypothetical protein
LFGLKTGTGQLPYSRITKISRGPEGHGLVFETERKADLIFLQCVFWEEILQLQSSSDCISAIECSPIFREVLNATVYIPHFPYTFTPELILRSFLETYLVEQSDLHFDEERFSLTFKIMLKTIREDFVEFETFIPIEQFSMDDEYIELVDGWKIERVPEDRLGELMPEIPRFGERNPDLSRMRFALVRISKEKREVVRKGERRQRLEFGTTESIKPEIIMTALRLLKKGFCSLSDWRVKPLDWLIERRSLGLGFPSTNIMSLFMRGGYHLTTDEVDELKELIMLLDSLGKKEELEIPINRFIYGIEREDVLDKLIDFMIALESLYLQQEDELKLRFSLRMATFVAQSEKEHGEIFTLMATAYSTRSKIVHGEKWNKIEREAKRSGYSIGDLIERVEEILRSSIIKYAQFIISGYSVKQVIEMIDVSIEQDIPFFRG